MTDLAQLAASEPKDKLSSLLDSEPKDGFVSHDTNEPAANDPLWQQVQRAAGAAPVDTRGVSPTTTNRLSREDTLSLYAKTKALKEQRAAYEMRHGKLEAGEPPPFWKQFGADTAEGALKPSSVGSVLGFEFGGPIGAPVGWAGGKLVELATDPKARQDLKDHPYINAGSAIASGLLPWAGNKLFGPVANRLASAAGKSPGELVAADLARSGTGVEGVPAKQLGEYIERAGPAAFHPPAESAAARLGTSTLFRTPQVAQARARAAGAASDLAGVNKQSAVAARELADRQNALPGLRGELEALEPQIQHAQAAKEMEDAARRQAGAASTVKSAEGAARQQLPGVTAAAGKLEDQAGQYGSKTALERALESDSRWREAGSSPEMANVTAEAVDQAGIGRNEANAAFNHSTGKRGVAGDLDFQTARADYANKAASYKASGKAAVEGKTDLAGASASPDLPPGNLNADLSAADELPKLTAQQSAKQSALEESQARIEALRAAGHSPEALAGASASQDSFGALAKTLGVSDPAHNEARQSIQHKLATGGVFPKVSTMSFGGAEPLDQQALNLAKAKAAVIANKQLGTPIPPEIQQYLDTKQPFGAIPRAMSIAGRVAGEGLPTGLPYGVRKFTGESLPKLSDREAEAASLQRQQGVLSSWLAAKRGQGQPVTDKDTAAVRHMIGLAPGLAGK